MATTNENLQAQVLGVASNHYSSAEAASLRWVLDAARQVVEGHWREEDAAAMRERIRTLESALRAVGA